MQKKLVFQKKVLAVGFLVLATFMFYAGIALFDWLLWFKSSFPLGVQGRYLFPAISAQMAVLLIGISFMIPKVFNFRPLLIAILPILMLVLNSIAL